MLRHGDSGGSTSSIVRSSRHSPPFFASERRSRETSYYCVSRILDHKPTTNNLLYLPSPRIPNTDAASGNSLVLVNQAEDAANGRGSGARIRRVRQGRRLRQQSVVAQSGCELPHGGSFVRCCDA